jgi:hypothetical protein
MKVPILLTAPEVARVISRLEPRSPMTEYQVRYLASQRCVRPSAHEPTASGDSALYAPVDVALIRLILRLVGEGAPYWMARAAVAQCAPELRAVLATSRAGVCVVNGPVGSVNPNERPTSAVAWQVPLAEVRRGLHAAILGERRRQPLWARWAPRTAADVAAVLEASA